MIYGLEITDEGKAFSEKHPTTRGMKLGTAVSEEVTLLKAIESPEDIVVFDIDRSPPIAVKAVDRLVKKGYAVRTDERRPRG